MTDIVTVSYQHGKYEVYDHYRNSTVYCESINDAVHEAENIIRYWRWKTRVKENGYETD